MIFTHPVALLVALAALVALVTGAFVLVRGWANRRALAERDAAAVTHLEALVMQRYDLHLSVDERGFPRLHGVARGVRYSVAREELEGGASGLRVKARRAGTGRFGLSLAPRERDLPRGGWDLLATNDLEFDARFAARSDRPEGAGAALDATVRGALELFPSVTLTLEGEQLTVDLGWLTERDLDDARIDALREVVSALCASGAAAVAT